MPFSRQALATFDAYRRQLTQSQQADLLDLIETIATGRNRAVVEYADVDAAILCSLS